MGKYAVVQGVKILLTPRQEVEGTSFLTPQQKNEISEVNGRREMLEKIIERGSH